MARPRNEIPTVRVKFKVNIVLLEKIEQQADAWDLTVPKMLGKIFTESLEEILNDDDYELHDMTETYVLTNNSNVHFGSRRITVFLQEPLQQRIQNLAYLNNCSEAAIRTSFMLDYLEARGLI